MIEVLLLLLMLTGFISYKLSASILNYIIDRVAEVCMVGLMIFGFARLLV